MHQYTRELFQLVRNEEYEYYKLVIDGKCQFDKFLEQVEKNVIDTKSIKGIFALMDAFSTKLTLPDTKFRHIQAGDVQNIYEFKKKELRVYILKEENEITIILGGYKKEQKNDIDKVRNRVKDYTKNI